MVKVSRYTADKADEWNTFVATSKNGTFLLDRSFMDYHSHRFADCSLMFHDSHNKLIAVLPANIDEKNGTVHSHQGLTYGGLIMSMTLSQSKVLECFNCFMNFYMNMGIEHVVYKPIPYIYDKYPAGEDLYALFRHEATLIGRGASQCIPLNKRIKTTESRLGGIRKARAAGLTIQQTRSEHASFWEILDATLFSLHNAHPVHSVDEMLLLEGRFPERIKLYVAKTPDNKILAGAWVFITDQVVHTQYLASSAEGKQCGALDLLIMHLIDEYTGKTAYLDFGISTEHGGTFLNEGLAFQKEGFGGRCVCYDTYEIK